MNIYLKDCEENRTVAMFNVDSLEMIPQYVKYKDENENFYEIRFIALKNNQRLNFRTVYGSRIDWEKAICSYRLQQEEDDDLYIDVDCFFYDEKDSLSYRVQENNYAFLSSIQTAKKYEEELERITLYDDEDVEQYNKSKTFGIIECLNNIDKTLDAIYKRYIWSTS